MIYDKVLLGDEGAFLEVFAPEKISDFVRDALLVIPGGGYGCVCADREGEPIALEFVQKGMASFVLHYSVGEMAKFPRPLIEASLAIKHIKDNAERYNINPDRVFVTGFSAGGHLTASIGTLWHLPEIYDAIDMPYGYNKPTGIIPVYPVISTHTPTHLGSFYNILGTTEPTQEELDRYSLELHVDQRSAPASIVHTSTDEAVPVQNALCFAGAYANAGMPFELHVFKAAPHGIALANEITECGTPQWINPSAENWTSLARLWMKTL